MEWKPRRIRKRRRKRTPRLMSELREPKVYYIPPTH